MATTNVEFSETEKELLSNMASSTPKGFASGGYVSGGPVFTNGSLDVLKEIRDLLKEIRDQRVIETTTPAGPPWYPQPYPVWPYPQIWS